MVRTKEEIEKVKDKRTLTKFEKELAREEEKYKRTLYGRLLEEGGLSEEKARELSDKYGKLSNFASAMRMKVDMGLSPEEADNLGTLALSMP